MGKKKFLNKKNSATFRLFSRDSSDPNQPTDSSHDGVFIRVDKNPFPSHGLFDHDDNPKDLPPNDSNSIFADADSGESDDFLPNIQKPRSQIQSAPAPLPDNIRKEILELGFPDDGYNYLLHMREIKNSGGGSSFYYNPKAKLDRVPNDVKAYDASKLRVVPEVDDDSGPGLMYSVASRTVESKIQRVVDPDVAALLDDSDMWRFASDVEDLEEDFVVNANLPEEGEGEGIGDEEIDVNEPRFEEDGINYGVPIDDDSLEEEEEEEVGSDCKRNQFDFKGRIRRPLDEEFEMLALQEYNSDDDGYVAEEKEDESLAVKLKQTLKDYKVVDFAETYRVPGDFKDQGSSGEEAGILAEVIQKCSEYAEMYEHESQEEDKETMAVEDSGDESQVWDCETVVSTYSNFDNHPGKIEAPASRRKKKPTEALSSGPLYVQDSNVISLRGKEGLPVDFLPRGRRTTIADEKKRVVNSVDELPKKGGGDKEMKEEKKERKAAVKAEKREARRAKKELKELYKGEAQRAQKVAAVSGPSAIHLM